MVMTAPRTLPAPRSSDAGELAAIEAAKVRNRKKLIEALRAGLRVEPAAHPGGYWVESGEKDGSSYRCWIFGAPDESMYYSRFDCSCRWAHTLPEGWRPCATTAAPCKHVLLLYWLAVEPDKQIRLTAADPELAIAFDAWRQVHAATGPTCD